jgi:hypothetical protein
LHSNAESIAPKTIGDDGGRGGDGVAKPATTPVTSLNGIIQSMSPTRDFGGPVDSPAVCANLA